jgi:lipid-binding SYLF domain-containing protein
MGISLNRRAVFHLEKEVGERQEWRVSFGMKSILIGLTLVLGAVTQAGADESAAELDSRIFSLATKFETLQVQPDKRIPPEVLRNAWGMVLLDQTHAGFVFAYEGGGGVALARDPKTRAWSPVAFVRADKGSFGLQIGGEEDFAVILLMTSNAPQYLTTPNFQWSGEARGTAGDATGQASSAFSPEQQPVLVYNNRQGLFGGVAVKGGAVNPDDQANTIYYKTNVTMTDILYGHKVNMTPTAASLTNKIQQYSRAGANSAAAKQTH